MKFVAMATNLRYRGENATVGESRSKETKPKHAKTCGHLLRFVIQWVLEHHPFVFIRAGSPSKSLSGALGPVADVADSRPVMKGETDHP